MIPVTRVQPGVNHVVLLSYSSTPPQRMYCVHTITSHMYTVMAYNIEYLPNKLFEGALWFDKEGMESFVGKKAGCFLRRDGIGRNRQ